MFPETGILHDHKQGTGSDFSQGTGSQTFDKFGIHLPAPVFSHGQLYIAFSRAKSFKDIYVNNCETTTQGRRNNEYITQNVVAISRGAVKLLCFILN